jgi:hypothetical protein
MAYYNIAKTLKTAEIGTILPWAGDAASSLSGWENQTRVGIPDGWIICDGGEKACASYPLLAKALGTTYGGLIGGTYPDYLLTDTFKLPNIQGRHLADYDTAYLPFDTEVQTAISPLMGTDTDNSVDVTPTVSADINFQVAASNNLVGKSTGLELSDPTYFRLFYTVSRKLGQNHTPIHDHGGGYTSVEPIGPPAELYQTPTPLYEINGKGINGSRGNGKEAGNTGDTSGSLRHTIYEFNIETHPVTDTFRLFNNAEVGPQDHPMHQGYTPVKASNYPYIRNGTGNFKNWSANLTQNPDASNKTYPVTFNHNFDDWANSDFPTGHNHGSFDVIMNKGGMKPPKTIYHNDVQTSNITPQNVANALTMNVDADTPSLNILYIIRAY